MAQRRQQDHRHGNCCDEGMAHRMQQISRQRLGIQLPAAREHHQQHHEDQRREAADAARNPFRGRAHCRDGGGPGQREAGEAHDRREPLGA